MTTSALFDNLGSIGANKGSVGDYAHAAATYLRSNYRLTPKVKFLYHVNIEINPTALAALGVGGNYLNKKELNLLVHTVELPRFSVDTDVKNQYNRKKITQTRMRYDPVRLQFHDDRQGVTTLFWESYFRYYYQDANYNSTSSHKPNNMYNDTGLNRYGFDKTNRLNVPFLNSIKVSQLYSLSGTPQFTAFTLVNPLISSWEHDEMDQSNGNTFVKNTMRIEYESMYYERGFSGEDNPAGFRDPAHYDTGKSKLSTGGGLPSLVDDWTNVFSDIFEGNIDLGTLLSGFRIINQDLPTNNTSFSVPARTLPFDDRPRIDGQNNIAFPRQSTFSEPTPTTQSNVTSTSAGNSTFSEVAAEASRNGLFAEELAKKALSVLPTSAFPADLQRAAQQVAIAGNINEKNAIFASLSANQKQGLVNTALANLNNINRG